MDTTRLTTKATNPLAQAVDAARRAPWITEGIDFFRRRRSETRPMTRAAIVKAIMKNRCHCGGTCTSCARAIDDMIGENYPH